MIRHKSTEKRARQNKKRYDHNKSIRSSMKTRVKRLLTSIENKETEAVQSGLKKAIPLIDKAASKGIIHRKNASRKISRLSKRAHNLLSAQQ